jgi:VWFA-related protein
MVYISSIIYSEPPLTLAMTKKMVCAQGALGLWTAGRMKALAIAASIGCLATLCGPLKAASEQQPLAQNGNNKICLDVVVTPKSGPPVAGLQQQDFTLLDNKAPQTITSFQALQGSTAPAEVIVVVDAVNMPYEKIPYERDQIDKFLHANGGRLAYPTVVAFFTDTNTRIEDAFSTDGNVVSNFLDQYELPLKTIPRTTGFYGALERLELSTKVLSLLAAREAPRPGRKIILWVSPGWPYLATTDAKIDLKQRSEIFANIVRLSTQLREAHITLYAIDPLPEGFVLAPLPAGNPYRRDSLPSPGRAGTSAPVTQDGDVTFVNLLYKDFLKGVTDARQASTGDLALQVLAVQSGGLALTGSKYVDDLMRQAIVDTENYYEISFDPPAARHPDEYQQIQIKVARPGLTARTRQGFYAQPVSQ